MGNGENIGERNGESPCDGEKELSLCVRMLLGTEGHQYTHRSTPPGVNRAIGGVPEFGTRTPNYALAPAQLHT